MCKAFVKLNRPWGDQSGGARKWAIRDGCQNSFQIGSPTWSLPTRFTSSSVLKAKQKTQARTVSKSKQLALGHGESPERELSPFDESNGPSNGAPWDPSKDPHPWRNEPAYQAHLVRQAELEAQKHDAKEEPVTPRSQQTQVLPFHSSGSGSAYSVSPHSPFSYNNHVYMQQGFYHPAYSSPAAPYAPHSDYADYGYLSTSVGNTQRLGGPASSGFVSANSMMSANPFLNGCGVGQARHIAVSEPDPYAAYSNSPPVASVDQCGESTYVGNPTTSANGSIGYWNPATSVPTYGYAGYGRADVAPGLNTTDHEPKDEDSSLSDAPSPDLKVEPL